MRPQWLTDVLRAAGALPSHVQVSSVSVTTIGQGTGMMGTVSRVTYSTAGGATPSGSLIMKSPSTSPTNRDVALAFHLYEREVHFYRELAPELRSLVPACFAAEHDAETGNFVILLADLFDYRCGDQVIGCGAEDARLALDALARIHAKWWNAPADYRPAWIPRITDDPFRSSLIAAAAASWRTTLDRFGDLVPLALRAQIPRFVERLPSLYARMGSGHQTVAHTDFRLDNLLFATSREQQPIVVLDWSSVFTSKGAQDVAFLLTQNVTTNTRRPHERDLVAGYHDRLRNEGVDGYSLEECWDDYQFAALFDLLYPIVIGGALDVSDERATAFVSAMVERCVATITDLDLLRLMPD